MLFLLGIVSPLLSIVIGVLILIFPQLLNYLVAIYLILSGIIGLLMRNALMY